MKVSRHNTSEEYSTTVDWIKDFERNIEKNANFLESLRSRHYLNNNFNSIEEKMADIRHRVGFDLVGAEKSLDGNVVTAGCADEDSSKEKCGPCSSGGKCGGADAHNHDNKHLELVSSMLDYIRSMAENESMLPGSVIVEKCMNDFGGSESMADDGLTLDMARLVNYADALAKDARRESEEEGANGSIKYVSPESDTSDGGVEPAEFSNRTSSG